MADYTPQWLDKRRKATSLYLNIGACFFFIELMYLKEAYGIKELVSGPLGLGVMFLHLAGMVFGPLTNYFILAKYPKRTAEFATKYLLLMCLSIALFTVFWIIHSPFPMWDLMLDFVGAALALLLYSCSEEPPSRAKRTDPEGVL